MLAFLILVGLVLVLYLYTRPKYNIRVLLICNPENRRAAFFQNALKASRLPAATVVSYTHLLDQEEKQGFAWTHLLASHCGSDTTIIRIESPGEDWNVEKRFIAWGAAERDVEYANSHADVQPKHWWHVCSADNALNMPFDKGQVVAPRQWFYGYRRLLRKWTAELRAASAALSHPIIFMNDPEDIIIMFDKCDTHTHIERAHQQYVLSYPLRASLPLPLPRAWKDIRSYSQLRQRMADTGTEGVFLKLANGSSASGVIAYSCKRVGHDGQFRERAVTSLELVPQPISGEASPPYRLYNSLSVRQYTDPCTIRWMADWVLAERAIVEEWLPKARQPKETNGVASRITFPFDLRIVPIRGKCEHVVVRRSKTATNPITNLHLGNERGNLRMFLQQVPKTHWRQITQQTCGELLAQYAFPNSLYMGVDLLVPPSMDRHYILEVNAFGDLLPRVVSSANQDTYTAEVEACLAMLGEFFEPPKP